MNQDEYSLFVDKMEEIDLGKYSQEVLGIFASENVFIYEYSNFIKEKPKDIINILPEPDINMDKPLDKIRIMSLLFFSNTNIRINNQSMFFVDFKDDYFLMDVVT